MRKKTDRVARESALVSGWTVEGDADLALDPAGAPAAQPLPGAHETASDPVVTPAAEASADPGAEDTHGAEKPQISNGALVSLGVFGGLYLLYTVGWFIVAQAYSTVNALTAAGSGSIGGILQQIVFWAAPLAPALWFFVALALSRGGKSTRLAILLAIGAVVLLPVPMLITRGA